MTLESRFSGVDGPIVIALSGGPDSAAIASLAVTAGVPFRCIHIDHQLPGSEVMRKAAIAIVAELGVELEVVVIEPEAASETALREARYEALLRRVRAGETLVTGHTSDDQAETVLLNLLRGTGPRGLAGIPARRGPIVRPFLDVSAAELRAVAADRGLPFVDDPENASTRHLRNRIRNELLPLIEGGYQPAVRATLNRTARHMSDLAEVLESLASRVPLERSTFGVRAAMGRLAAVDGIVRRQVFRVMLSAVRPPMPPTEDEVHRLEATVSGGGPSEFSSTDARGFVEGPWLVVSEPIPPETAVARLVDGSAWGRFRFGFETVQPGEVRLSRWRFVTNESALMVRPVRPGDTIAIRAGAKSAVEAIRERHVAPESHPVVVDGSDHIVWIPGVRHAWGPPAGEATRDSGYLVIVANQDSPWAPFEP
jgi:tRNA(Ile)-lysidine synthetase-like protein